MQVAIPPRKLPRRAPPAVTSRTLRRTSVTRSPMTDPIVATTRIAAIQTCTRLSRHAGTSTMPASTAHSTASRRDCAQPKPQQQRHAQQLGRVLSRREQQRRRADRPAQRQRRSHIARRNSRPARYSTAADAAHISSRSHANTRACAARRANPGASPFSSRLATAISPAAPEPAPAATPPRPPATSPPADC